MHLYRSIWDHGAEESLCWLVDMVEREEERGGLSLSPSLSLSVSLSLYLPPSLLAAGVFIFFLSWLCLHARCHILIPHSSKLIRDDSPLMETVAPKHTLPLNFPLLLSSSASDISSLKCNFHRQRKTPLYCKGHPNMLVKFIDYQTTNEWTSFSFSLTTIHIGGHNI